MWSPSQRRRSRQSDAWPLRCTTRRPEAVGLCWGWVDLTTTLLTIGSTTGSIDWVVNTRANLTTGAGLVAAYVLLTVASIVVLVIMSATGSEQATSAAWGHAVIVAVLAVLLPLRMRAARRGSSAAARAVMIIALVVLVVNLIEAALPHAFPGWMRIEMVAVAVVMALLVTAMLGAHRQGRMEAESSVR